MYAGSGIISMLNIVLSTSIVAAEIISTICSLVISECTCLRGRLDEARQLLLVLLCRKRLPHVCGGAELHCFHHPILASFRCDHDEGHIPPLGDGPNLRQQLDAI